MILNVSLDLPGDGVYLRVARHISRTLLEDLGVVSEDIDDLEFVLGELGSNVIRHAQAMEDRYTVSLEYFADHVVLMVVDRGVGFSFKDVRPIGASRPDMGGGERIGGFGLDLVRHLADKLEFLRSDVQGTTVRAEKKLRYNSPANARDATALDQSGGGMISVRS